MNLVIRNFNSNLHLLQQKTTITNNCGGNKKPLSPYRIITVKRKEQLLASTDWKVTEELTPLLKFGPSWELISRAFTGFNKMETCFTDWGFSLWVFHISWTGFSNDHYAGNFFVTETEIFNHVTYICSNGVYISKYFQETVFESKNNDWLFRIFY